jgi:hypothetical protein
MWVVLESFLIPLFLVVEGMLLSCSFLRGYYQGYISRVTTQTPRPRILPGRTKGPKRQMAGDTSGPPQNSTDSCQPIKAVRWLVHLEHEGHVRLMRGLITATAAMRTRFMSA